MKKIIILIMVLLIIGAIFVFAKDEKIYYFAFSTDEEIKNSFSKIEEYYKKNKIYENGVEYIKNNYRTIDLLNDINNNVKLGENVSIKNALIKADVIILMIGKNDYINYLDDYKLLEDNLINLKEDMEKLLKAVRNISKEKIILIGVDNNNVEDNRLNLVLKKLNEMYSKLCDEYNIYYLDIYNDLEKLNINGNISNETYNYIIDKLIKEMDDDIIN